MIDTQPFSFTDFISQLRDTLFIAGFLVVGWKTRGLVQPAIEFFNRANRHMEVMESGMSSLLNNHLHHIEVDLKELSGRKHEVEEGV